MATNNTVNTTLSGQTGTGNFVGSISPRITTSILDANGNTIIGFTPIGSAVNYLNIEDAATLNNVVLSALGSDTNITLALVGKGNGGVAIQGNMTGTGYASGYVGELFSSVITFASATSITNNTNTNLTNLLLTPGDWDVWGNIGASGTTVTFIDGGITTASTTAPPNAEFTTRLQPLATTAAASVPVVMQPINVSSNTTVYLNMVINGTGPLTMFGALYARRR